VWYEQDVYPWPLAARENLFAMRWEASESGGLVRIVQCAVNLKSHPQK